MMMIPLKSSPPVAITLLDFGPNDYDDDNDNNNNDDDDDTSSDVTEQQLVRRAVALCETAVAADVEVVDNGIVLGKGGPQFYGGRYFLSIIIEG